MTTESMPPIQIIPERLEALTAGEITLDKGAHGTFERGHCAMEVVAWLAGLGHTDGPSCASPVLSKFTIGLNDHWDEEQRQSLVPFLPRMVGTGGDGQDETRSYLALDWLIRTYTPTWLDLAGLTAEAQELRDLPSIVDLVSAQAVESVLLQARDRAANARASADTCTGNEAVGLTAAGEAAAAAVWESAGDGVQGAAWQAAWGAAQEAIGVDAWGAAWEAAGVAQAAAGANARDVLLSTAATLQASALELLDRMIDPAKATEGENA